MSLAPLNYIQDCEFGTAVKESKFDWYNVNLQTESPQSIVDIFSKSFDCDFLTSFPQKPYSNGMECLLGGKRLFKMSYGGVNAGVFLGSSGDLCPSFVEFVKKTFPVYSVSRFDSAVDFDEVGAFDTLHRMAVDIAKKFNLKIKQVGDFTDNGKGGRTIYIGSRSSMACMRIYEKGKELLTKELDVEASLDWVRLEIEVKPSKSFEKEYASNFDPIDAFRMTKWTKEVGRMLGAVNLNLIDRNMVNRSNNNFDTKLYYMLYQYGAVLEEHLANLDGDIELFARTLLDKIPLAREKVVASKKA
jgi:hypothetical protein